MNLLLLSSLILSFPLMLACGELKSEDKVLVQEKVVEKIVEVPVLVPADSSLGSRFSEFEADVGTMPRFKTILERYDCRLTEEILEGCTLPEDFLEMDYLWEIAENMHIMLLNHDDYKEKDTTSLYNSISRLQGSIEKLPIYAAEKSRIEKGEKEIGEQLGWVIDRVVTVGLLKRAKALANFRKVALDEKLLVRARKHQVKILVYREGSMTYLDNNTFYIGYEVAPETFLEKIEAELSSE